MSVYTEIPENQIAMFCSQFGVAMAQATPIQNGVENSNWFITENNGTQYVMTLFEERDFNEVKTLSRIMQALDHAGLPVASPLTHESGLLHAKYRGKALQVAPRLAGSHPEAANLDMCRDMGKWLAKLHASLATLTPAEDFTLAQYPWQAVRDAQMAKMSVEDKKLIYKVWQSYDRVQIGLSHDYASDQDALPKGLTHGDLFLDNTLWEGDKLTGLLDFTEVCTDHLIMDIAITANDFCTNWQNGHFDNAKCMALIEGYSTIRSLTRVELQVLPVFLAMAAARFWLLRLDIVEQNAEKNRGGENVLVKSPKLMRDLAAQHVANI